MPAIAAFDLDGTLVRGDTMQQFIRYVVGNRRFYWGLLRFSFVIFRLKVLNNISRKKAKSRFLQYYFKNKSRKSLEAYAEAFAASSHYSFRPDTLARLRWHQQQGHHCLIVSASLDIWVRPIAASLNIPSISSKALYEQDRCMGIEGENCHGPEKVRRLISYIGDMSYDQSYAYGDTSGDREMIQWADQGFWVHKPLPLWE